MSSAMLMERTMMGGSPVSTSPTQPMMGQPTTNFCVVPRCEIKVEKCTGGMKMHCRCEDEMACATLQNLCKMLAGGMCSISCTNNGIMMCQCNLVCGMVKIDYTKDGCTITCTTGDKPSCEMIQCCCETIASCIKNGCCCYVCLNNTPVCCGC